MYFTIKVWCKNNVVKIPLEISCTYQVRQFHTVWIVLIKELNCIQYSFQILDIGIKLASRSVKCKQNFINSP